MARDPRKLRVFRMSDELVPDIYLISQTFPAAERYGLVAQMRRAAVSVPTNIVEGCARRTVRDYVNFLNIANGSAHELSYLLLLSQRLGFVPSSKCGPLFDRAEYVAASLTALIEALDRKSATI